MASKLLSLSLYFVFIASCFEASLGLKLPIRRHGNLAKRTFFDNMENTIFTPPGSSGLFVLTKIEGFPVPVQVDLSSADLYVTGFVPGDDEFAATSIQADITLSFLDPPISGDIPIKEAVLVSIGGLDTEQTFALDPTNNTGLQREFPNDLAQGVLGFGPTSQSSVVKAIRTGHSPLDQLYISNATAPFSTILFSGFDETMPTQEVFFSGMFSVGEALDLNDAFPDMSGTEQLPDLTKITDQPPISLNNGGAFPVTQFTVNGKSVSLSSTQGAPSNNALGVLTSTELYSVASEEIVQAIYASVPGASQNEGTGVFNVPCNTEINVTVSIGPVNIPLDPTSVVLQNPTSNGCVGSFRANKAAATPGHDISFGTSFFPNVYILIGYNSISGETLNDPIIKLLPLTNVSSAHQYFTNTRHNETNNMNFPPIGTAPVVPIHGTSTTSATVSVGTPIPLASSGPNEKAAGALDRLESSSTPLTQNGPTGNIGEQLKHCLPAIILGAIILGVILIGVIIYALVHRRRRPSGTRETAYRNIHNAEATDYSKALYGHDDEPTLKYSDPYQDGGS